MANDRMDPKTLAALEASIAAWHRKWEMAATDAGLRAVELCACPLCDLVGGRVDCLGCPVQARTGRNQCHGTPFWGARAARLRFVVPPVEGESLIDLEIARGAFRAAAAREIRFLKSLLPPAASRDGIVGSGA